MKSKDFEKVLRDTLKEIDFTLRLKAMEYVRSDNAMHNFDEGARMEGKIREEIIHGFALKHHISIRDMRKGFSKNGTLPSKEQVNEKFNDAINYLILEKASFLDRIKETGEF